MVHVRDRIKASGGEMLNAANFFIYEYGHNLKGDNIMKKLNFKRIIFVLIHALIISLSVCYWNLWVLTIMYI